MRKLIPLGCVAMALALIAPATGLAATFKVNTSEDTSVTGGCTTEPVCSLRDAIRAAGESTDPEDVVLVPAGSYPLSAGELLVAGTGTVTIRGEGARKTTIDAQHKSRAFNLEADRSVLEGLTVTGGVSDVTSSAEEPGDGGGILAYEAEEAILRGVDVSGNTASQNGAGVSAPPEGVNKTVVTIEGSTIAGNHVAGGAVEALGGGVYVLGKFTMVNSTVSGNSAESTAPIVQGGGVLLAIDPASTEGSEGTIVNSTISGNSVGVAGIGGGLSVYNPEPMVGGSAALSLKNTIIAGNTGPMGPSDCGTVATVTSDHNLSGDASCMFTDPGSKQNANPQLGPLQDNGGETDTLALLAGSPAIDAGTNAGCPPTDQRGVSRPQGPGCDIGAFELVPARPAPPAPKPPVAAAADLRLRIKPKPKHPRAGRKLAFLITVRNGGPATATGAILKGAVPALTRKASGPKVNGKNPCKLGKARKGKRQLTCNLGDIAAGKTKKLRVAVRAPHAGKLHIRASVRSGVADPNPKDNKAKSGVRIRG
jgi:CSLREA domain-containing protein